MINRIWQVKARLCCIVHFPKREAKSVPTYQMQHNECFSPINAASADLTDVSPGLLVLAAPR